MARVLAPSVRPAFLARAEEIFKVGFYTDRRCCRAVENWQFFPVPLFALTGDRQRQEFMQWLPARAEPNPSEV